MMKNNKKRNKISKRIILCSIALSSVVGSSLLIQTTFNSLINDKINKTNSNSLLKKETTANLSENTLSLTPTAPLIATSFVKTSDYIVSYFPFQAERFDVAALKGLFNVVGGITMEDALANETLKVEFLPDNKAGNLSLNIAMNPYVNSSGIITNEVLQTSYNYNGFHQVAGATGVSRSTTNVTNTDYASVSVISNQSSDASKYSFDSFYDKDNYLMNGTIPSGTDDIATVQTLTVKSWDNEKGSILLNFNLKNYTDSSGNFWSDTIDRTISISGYKKVLGETILTLDDSKVGLIRPVDFGPTPVKDWWKNYFELTNPLTNTTNAEVTKVDSVAIKDPDNTNGSLTVEVTVQGGYYNSTLEPVELPDGQTHIISFRVSGFAIEQVEVDNTNMFIYIGIGGFVVLSIIVIMIILIIKKKNKKFEETRKRKNMEDRLNMSSNSSNKNASGSNIGTSPSRPGGMGPGGVGPGGMGPGGVGPGGMGPGGVGPGGMGPARPGVTPKYVPPTISVPKSNAPQVKRPSNPIPIKK